MRVMNDIITLVGDNECILLCCQFALVTLNSTLAGSLQG